jgi:hypothetical protein
MNLCRSIVLSYSLSAGLDEPAEQGMREPLSANRMSNVVGLVNGPESRLQYLCIPMRNFSRKSAASGG